MDWWLALILILGSLVLLFASGTPVAFAFLLVMVVGAIIFWGGEAGLKQLAFSIYDGVAKFVWIPLPLFVLMGTVAFESGLAVRSLDVLDAWLGRLPGRLALVAVGGGVIFSVLTGSSMSSTAVLAKTLVPEMERRGYRKSMSLGPVMGSAGLAVMIPPSGMAVVVGAIARISIAGVLIAGIIPGLLMAALYTAYIMGRCWLQPSVAPSYAATFVSLRDRLMGTVRYILPLGLVVFSVTGVIILGIATPTEAAATGCLGIMFLTSLYRRLSWKVMKEAVSASTRITIMILMIIAGAVAFSQILAFSGASRGIVELAAGFAVTPVSFLILSQSVLLVLGCLMGPYAMMMISFPIFMPIVSALNIDPLLFGALALLNVEMGNTTPPFGAILFVMSGIAPRGTTMGDVYRAGLPFLACDAIMMALMIAFLELTLWLPALIR